LEDTDAQGQLFWPELQELARPARERRRLPPDTRSEIIVRLCSRAPLSVKELSILLDRSEAYIGDAIRPLVNDGSLTFLYPDQPRHPRQKYLAGRNASSNQVTILDPDDAPDRLFNTAAPRFPNLWTNVAYVIGVGLVLGISHAPVWLLFAVGAAAALAGWHVTADSSQYRRFRELKPRRGKPTEFMVLKSAVTVIEIAIVYLVTSAGF
jgi:hypothetical protein